jgi:Nuclease-related domain
VKFQLWEIGVAAGAMLLAVLLFAAGGVVQGAAFVLFAAVWAVARADVIADVRSAGRAARFQARLGIARFVVLLIIYFAAVVALFIVAFSDEKATTLGQIAAFALCGFTVLLFRELRRTDDDTVNWLKGSKAEEKVGGELDQLRREGWVVIHGLTTDWGGDVDHILCGPQGAYAVETKSGRFRKADLRQATYNAVWVKRKLGVPW